MVEKNYGSIFLDLTITNFFINAISVIANFLKEQFTTLVDYELQNTICKDKLIRFKYLIIIGFFILFSMLCTIILIDGKSKFNRYDIIYVISMIFYVMLITLLIFYLITIFYINIIKRKCIGKNNKYIIK